MKYKVTFLGLGWYEVEARSRKEADDGEDTGGDAE